MIFNVPGHIEMIRNGLCFLPADNLNSPAELRIVKTQSRRLNRGIYQVEAERTKPHKVGYAVQRKRAVKAEPDIRILFDRIWEETRKYCGGYDYEFCISKEDAWSEGGYTREQYEKVFRELDPKWHGWSRWAFEFHAIEVQNQCP